MRSPVARGETWYIVPHKTNMFYLGQNATVRRGTHPQRAPGSCFKPETVGGGHCHIPTLYYDLGYQIDFWGPKCQCPPIVLAIRRYTRVRHRGGESNCSAEITSTNSLTSSAEPLTSTWKSGSESSVPSAEKEVLVAAAMFCSGSRSTREEREKERQRRAGGGGRGGGVDQERALAARAGYPLLCQYSMCWGGRAPNPPQKKPR